jgi:hypothetical protein
MWRRYYERWSNMITEELGHDMVELVPALGQFVPPGRIFDKNIYSRGSGAIFMISCAGAESIP